MTSTPPYAERPAASRLAERVDRLRRALGVARVVVVELDEAGPGRGVVVASSPRGDAAPVALAGTICALAAEGEPLIVPANLRTRMPAAANGFLERADSAAALPLFSSSGVVAGVLATFDVHPVEDPDALRRALRAEEPVIALELECAGLRREIAVLKTRCEMVGDVTTSLLDARPLAAQVEDALRIVCEQMAADAGVVRVVKGRDLVLLAAHGVPVAQRTERLPRGEGIAFEIESLRQPLAIERVDHHHATAEKAEIPHNAFQFKAYAGAPMISDGVVIGILGVYETKAPRQFTRADLGQLQIIANFLALALLNNDLLAALGGRLSAVHRGESV